MACKLGDFEGTWTAIRGFRKDGGQLIIEKNESQYRLLEEGRNDFIYNDLRFDDVACTLKNDSTCLSLFKDCEHLFGIEEFPCKDGTLLYEVWGATKNLGSSNEDLEPSEDEPNWRLDKGWTVRARTGDPPLGYRNKVVIREREVGVTPYQIGVEGQDPFDGLSYNSKNRTLDSDIRTVATWRREALKKPSFVFGMVIVSQNLLADLQGLPVGADLSSTATKILRNSGRYLPFEIKMLVESLVDSKLQSSIGVWGAEEG